MGRYTATIHTFSSNGIAEIRVSADYTPAERGKTSGAPEDCYPGEPERFDGFEARDKLGRRIELRLADLFRAHAAIRKTAEDEADYDRIF